MKYCQYCGKQIDDSSKFCDYCGRKQPVMTEAAPNSAAFSAAADTASAKAADTSRHRTPDVVNASAESVDEAPAGGAVADFPKRRPKGLIVGTVVIAAAVVLGAILVCGAMSGLLPFGFNGDNESGSTAEVSSESTGAESEEPTIWEQVSGDYSAHWPSSRLSASAVLTLATDGTFTGMSFRDVSEASSTKHDIAVVHFSGSFTDPVSNEDGTYTMRLAQLEASNDPDEVTAAETGYIKDYANYSDVRIVEDDNFDGSVDYLGDSTSGPAGSFTIYPPGTSTTSLSSGVQYQYFLSGESKETADYLIVNEDEQRGFVRESE